MSFNDQTIYEDQELMIKPYIFYQMIDNREYWTKVSITRHNMVVC